MSPLRACSPWTEKEFLKYLLGVVNMLLYCDTGVFLDSYLGGSRVAGEVDGGLMSLLLAPDVLVWVHNFHDTSDLLLPFSTSILSRFVSQLSTTIQASLTMRESNQ